MQHATSSAYSLSFVARWIMLLGGASLVASLVCAACTASAPASSTPTLSTPADPARVTVVPTDRAGAAVTRIPSTRTPIRSTNAITLTLWTTEDFAPSATPAGRILRSQFDAFTAANPNIKIEVVLKKPYGKGGMLDFLTTTSAVVPEHLPDLLTIDMAQVPQAMDTGTLQPLDGWLPAELNNDLFPFAVQAAHYKKQWIAVPFVTDVQHLVFNKTRIKRAPTTWDEFLKQKSALLLPVGGDDAFLLQYLSLVPPNDDSQLVFDQAATAQVLNFFKRSRDANLMPDSASGLKSADEVWTPFAANPSALAQVSASRYLTEREKQPNLTYAPLPTREGKVTMIATGWAFAVTATDTNHQAAATRFVQWLVQSDRLAPWLLAAHRLPASRTTLNQAINPPDYAAFLRDGLEHAVYLPLATPRESKLLEAWRVATLAVWKGQTTPEDAAQNVAAAMK